MVGRRARSLARTLTPGERRQRNVRDEADRTGDDFSPECSTDRKIMFRARYRFVVDALQGAGAVLKIIAQLSLEL